MAKHIAASAAFADVVKLVPLFAADTDEKIEVVIPEALKANAPHYTQCVNFVQPPTCRLAWIHGAGDGRDGAPDGGGDKTYIYDDAVGDTMPIFTITPNSTDGIQAIFGFTFHQTNKSRAFGSLNISGHYEVPQKYRYHHCHFITQGGRGVGFGGRVVGVDDHNIYECDGSSAKFYNSWSDGQGDKSWAEPTGFGTLNFPIGEDNVYRTATRPLADGGQGNSGVMDSYRGSRWLERFSDVDRMAFQTHPTGGSGRARGTRAFELYGVKVRNLGPNQNIAEFNFMFWSSGPGLLHYNDIVGTTLYQNGVTAHVNRRDGNPYLQAGPHEYWGYAGPKYQVGAVNVSGTTVTWVNGAQFPVGLLVGTKIIIGSESRTVAAFNSPTSISIKESVASQSGVGYILGSNWDGNQDVLTGYPCIDQIGRGQGDELAGDFGEGMVNLATGKNYRDPGAWPRQSLEPGYVFGNIYEGASVWSPSNGADAVKLKRDYYTDETGGGVGKGLVLPTTAGLPGDGFVKLDGGTWLKKTPEHGNTATPNFMLHVRDSAGAWQPKYQPIEYPHPYIALTKYDDGPIVIPPEPTPIPPDPTVPPLPTPIPPNGPPTVKITNPMDGALITVKTQNITVLASDDTGVAWLELWINDQMVKQAATTTMSYSWNTSPYKGKGTVTIKAIARDADKELVQTSIAVTVKK